jgi:hypothetical protein
VIERIGGLRASEGAIAMQISRRSAVCKHRQTYCYASLLDRHLTQEMRRGSGDEMAEFIVFSECNRVCRFETAV